MNFFVFFFFFFFFSVVVPSSAGDFSKPSRTNVAVYFKAVMLVYIFRSCPSDRPRLDIRLHVLMCHGVGSVGAGVHWAVLEWVFTGQCWSRCSLGSVGAGVHWAVLEQVFL